MELDVIYNEDCLVGMQRIPDGSVDCIICDLPYGVLNKSNPSAKWDCQLPLDKLWSQYLRTVKPNGAIVLFGQGMFTAKLMMSQPKLWRYNLIWDKISGATGFLNANKQPLRIHEDILVFYRKQPTYNPQFMEGAEHARGGAGNSVSQGGANRHYDSIGMTERITSNKYFPNSVLRFKRDGDKFHPTQKPVALIEYLIRTYTNEGELVLDNCMGSGTTAIACVNTNRKFIGYEMNKGYYDITVKRIKDASI